MVIQLLPYDVNQTTSGDGNQATLSDGNQETPIFYKVPQGLITSSREAG